MADLTADELAFIRGLIGTSEPPTNADLELAYDRLLTPELVAAEVIQSRLMGPQKVALDGDITVDWGNRKFMAETLADLRNPTGGGPSQGLLYRTDRER